MERIRPDPSLAERLVVRLDAVHDDAPLSLDVDGAQRGHVRRHRRTEVRLVAAVLQDIHRVVRVGDHVLSHNAGGIEE